MNCKQSRQGQISLVQVAVEYAQALAERLTVSMSTCHVGLDALEQGVLAELHEFGSELFQSLVGLRSARYPATTVPSDLGR
jgi:hypothetical protein